MNDLNTLVVQDFDIYMDGIPKVEDSVIVLETEQMNEDTLEIYWAKESHTEINMKDFYDYEDLRVNVIGQYTGGDADQPECNTGFRKLENLTEVGVTNLAQTYGFGSNDHYAVVVADDFNTELFLQIFTTNPLTLTKSVSLGARKADPKVESMSNFDFAVVY